MPAHRTTDGDLDHAPLYVRRAIGLDTSWRSQARCLGQGVELGNIWLLEDNDEVVFEDADGNAGSTYSGKVLTEMALEWCSICPAQYDCAKFGVITKAPIGTYGIHIDLLKMLIRRQDWESIIDEAQAADVTVQSYVSLVLDT